MRANLREIAKAAAFDPKEALLEAIADLDEFDVFHNLILLATYIAPEKTSGGIIMPDRSILEGRFQGKIGLVLKLGPLAFQDDAIAKFGGVIVSPGDWAIYNPSDAGELFLRHRTERGQGVPCRLIEDSLIKGRVADPAFVY